MRRRKNIFWGGLLVFLAGYMVADAFEVFTDGPSVFVLGLSIILAGISISSLFDLDYFGIFIPLSFIAFINAHSLDIVNERWTIVLAAFILSAGLSVMFKKRRTITINGKKHSKYFDEDIIIDTDFEFTTDESYDGPNESFTSSGPKGSADSFVKVSTSFSDHKRYVRSDNFTQADLECNFGQLTVHFESSSFNPSGSHINVESNFGSTILYLPRTVNVENRLESVASSINSNSINVDPNAPTVTITGEANFGSIKIYTV